MWAKKLKPSRVIENLSGWQTQEALAAAPGKSVHHHQSKPPKHRQETISQQSFCLAPEHGMRQEVVDMQKDSSKKSHPVPSPVAGRYPKQPWIPKHRDWQIGSAVMGLSTSGALEHLGATKLAIQHPRTNQ